MIVARIQSLEHTVAFDHVAAAPGASPRRASGARPLRPAGDRSLAFDGGPVGVLLIHGLGGTPAEMKPVGRKLADAGATVLCCQLAGHCGTEADLAATTWRDWYASVEKALLLLEQRCSRIIVGGLSMGAVLAALLAAREPSRVHGLLMMAPTLWYDGWSTPWYRSFLKLFLLTPIGRRWRFEETEPFGIKDERTRAVVQRAMFSANSSAAGLSATPGASVRELSGLIKALKPELPSIRQPALIIHARDDDMASLTNAFYLQRKLGGLVESLVLDDCYHIITIDRQRSVVIDRAARFVSSFAETAETPRKAKRVA